MTVSLSPILNAHQSFLSSGLPNNGGLIYTYAAGTTTPLATYTTSAGITANSNPIVLSADGRPSQQIWLTDGLAYKLVVTDSTTSPIAGASFDNIGLALGLAIALAAPTGSSLIGHLATTVAAKLGQTMNIDDKGADPTGVADSASAILLAVASGATRITATSSGTYSVSSVTLPSNIELDFCGATVNARTASVPVFTNAHFSSGSDSNIAMKNVTINGNKSTLAGVNGLSMQNVNGLHLYNVNIANSSYSGVWVGASSSQITLERCHVTGCGDGSVDVAQASNVTLLGATADYPSATRIQGASFINCVVDNAYGNGVFAQFIDNVSVVGGLVTLNGRGRVLFPTTFNGVGISVGQGYGVKLTGVSSTLNKESGCDLSGRCTNISVTGGSYLNNVLTGIYTGNGDLNVSISGVTAKGNGGHGIWLDGSILTSVGSITGCTTNLNGLHGIFVSYVNDFSVVGNTSYSNAGNGINIDSNCNIGNISCNLAANNTAGDYSFNATNQISIGFNHNYGGHTFSTDQPVHNFDRLNTFGSILKFAKDGTPIGYVNHTGGALQLNSVLGSAIDLQGVNSTMTFFDDAGTSRYLGSGADNVINLGRAGWRFATVYAGTGTISTSDATTKQDVAALTTAEQSVAKAIKSLIRTYRFIDAVKAKGAAARTHVGVMAQDVQAAFIAAGLDPTKYSLFCSDTWFELNGSSQDADDDLVTAETPGSISVTRLGIRYDELMAFVIAAI